MQQPSNPYDELAAMFLTGSRATTTATVRPTRPATSNGARRAAILPPARPKAVVEALIAGHLPVRGNLWLPPYVEAVARAHGPAALLQLDGPSPGLDAWRLGRAAGSSFHPPSFTHAVEQIAADIDVWIVRASNTGDLKLALADSSLHIDRITLLTGADEAALVAAYQTIKQLAEASAPLPPVQVAVVGCDDAIAAAAIERLNRTTLNFLGIEVQPGLCIPRMDAIALPDCTCTFDPMNAVSLAEAVNVIAQSHRRRRTVAAAPTTAPNRQPTPSRQVNGETETNARSPLAPMKPHNDAAVQSIKLAPKAARTIEAKHDSPTVQDEAAPRADAPAPLASYVEGLSPLPPRAPGHQRIELAVDPDGRMHLLGDEATLREMPLVAKWVLTHHQLLSMACPQHRINPQHEPQCHIFCEKPVSLADLHATDYCLHVLAPVAVNGHMAWYSAPLNIVRA